MRLMPFLIMLAVMSAAGSIIFAAAPVQPATEQTQPAAKAPDKIADTKTPAAAGATGSKTPEVKADAKADPKADPKADAKTDDKSGAGKAAEHDASAASTDKTGDKPGDKPADKSPADKSSPQRFVPSEQVRADFDVSFPVDI
jgi:hypothetical protein